MLGMLNQTAQGPAEERAATEDSDDSSEPSEWFPAAGEQVTQRDRSPGYDRGSEWRDRFTAHHTEATLSPELKGVSSAIFKSRSPARERPQGQAEAQATGRHEQGH